MRSWRGLAHAARSLLVPTFFVGAIAVSPLAHGDVTLPAVLGHHMVLEQGRPLAFWGTASAGEKVTVSALGETASATADGKGRWRLELPAPTETNPAPFEVVVEGKNRIVLRDVVLGEVWLAAGQSNMEWPVYAADGAESVLFVANLPKLRIFQVKRPAPENLTREPGPARGRWAVLTPENAARFSAVAFYFGQALAERRSGPIGLIQSTWGGSRIEPWIRRAALAPKKFPRLAPALAALAKGPSAEAANAYRTELAAWEQSRQALDPGDQGTSLGHARAGTPGSGGWRQAELPAAIETVAGRPIDGAIWWRREIELPSGFVGAPLYLRLGAIDQCDTTYVDGALVGATCEPTVFAGERFPRGYKIPASLTNKRRLTIAVRVWDPGGPGGLVGPAEAMRLVAGESPDGPSLALDGPWSWKIETEITPPPASLRPKPPEGFATYQSPGVLWDNMVDGLAPFGLRGVLWYQGESNVKQASDYRPLMTTLMQDWRQAFGNPKLPFFLVQLAAHRPRFPSPGSRTEEEWPELREAQAEIAAADPSSGLAVTIDLGARDDIHPRNKRDVGRRLAQLALAKLYREPVGFSGPVYDGHKVEKNGRVRVRFRHAAGLGTTELAALPPAAPERRLLGFELSGADRKFVPAAAEIDGETVVLSAPGVKKPVAVRYAFSDDPVANLSNWAGLPAAPFRTDRWPRFSERLARLPLP